MAVHGHLGEFEASKDDWKSYIERAKQYFTANEVTSAAKKRAILLSACGPVTYRVIRDVLTPEAPTDVALDVLIEKMSKHFQPTPSEIVQRFRFNTRVRSPHETVATYVAQLKQAMKLLLSLEAAEKEVKDLSGKKEVMQIRKKHQNAKKVPPKPVSRPPRSGKGSSSMAACYRCGGNHSPDECPFKLAECHFCHRKGHIAPVCRLKTRQRRRTQNPAGRNKSVHKLTESEEPEFPEYSGMYNCRSPNNQPLFAEMQINSASIRMEVDTGATLSIISRATYDATWSSEDAPPIKLSEAKLHTYTGEEIPVDGAIDVEVAYRHQKASLSLVVVAGRGPSLMGRNWMEHFQLDWCQLHQVHSEPKDMVKDMLLQDMLDRHASLFKKELGKIAGTTAKLYLKPGA